MILYDNRDLLALICNRTGSVLLTRRVLIPATLSTIFCALLLSFPEVKEHLVVTGSVIRIFASILGYTIVFRTNMAFQRFFEGVEHVMSMFSKWRDACITLFVFIEVSLREHVRRGNVQQVQTLVLSRARLLHWFSLLTAMAVQKLSIVEDGEDIEAGFCITAAPANRMHNKHHSVSGDVCLPPQQLKGAEDGPRVVGQLTPQEKAELKAAPDPIMLIIKWIQVEVSSLTVSGHFVVAPPLLSRVYQELSNGMLALFMAMKIPMVPFPFPFAQFLQYALFGFFAFCPCAVLEYIEPPYATLDSTWLFLLMNFMACAGFAALNEVAVELEAPFGDDENDYTLHCEQWAIVSSMEDLYFVDQPTDFDVNCFGDKVTRLILDKERRATANRDGELGAVSRNGKCSSSQPLGAEQLPGAAAAAIPKGPAAVAVPSKQVPTQAAPAESGLAATFGSLATEVSETVQMLHKVAEEQFSGLEEIGDKLQRLHEVISGTNDAEDAKVASEGIASSRAASTAGTISGVDPEGRRDFSSAAGSSGSARSPLPTSLEQRTSWQVALLDAWGGADEELRQLLHEHQRVSEGLAGSKLKEHLPRLEPRRVAVQLSRV
mmetsp:Transcript_36983/g.85334  ORF Transcript_36983/g.85334 Transcript_36983/m.85334 type:complete len:604 (+) Transcript_36983:11-1822(+)